MRLAKFFTIILALGLTGCATSRKVQDLETKVGIIEGRINTIEQRQGITESQTGESRESVGYLKGKVESFPVAPSTTAVAGAKGNEGLIYKASPGKMTKKDIQKALKNANFYDGPIDGMLGKRTRRAIKEFQKSVGLKADGIIGRETMEKLSIYLTN
ncbi:MAG: peptidoglycan-binding domain-containing protein [Candidatus Omnitrophota bacterium]|nr:peptidoglycan-binding domain-containing protein [Candidatus Omnitrophota bacterium]